VWGRDRVVERMAALKNFMNATVSQPTVYYIHCDCGKPKKQTTQTTKNKRLKNDDN